MKLDMLYPYEFNGRGSGIALKRLKASIDSVIDQDVTICVVNTSKKCIWNKIKSLSPNMRYIHKESTRSFSKSRTINFGVKQLVRTPYFILSDIDLVYQSNYVEQYQKYCISPIPKRVIPFNYNLKVDFIDSDYNEYLPFINNRDLDRAHFGIAPGNGLIHLGSFNLIRGFNEDLFGYAPEDADFNERIKYVGNDYIEDNNPLLRTIHMHHPITANLNSNANEINFHKFRTYLADNLKHINFDFYHTTDKSLFLQGIEIIQTNKNREWGVLG